jgi:NIPSNAP
MIYELRIYRCVPGRMAALLSRFETLRIWKKHGIRQAGLWTTLIGKSTQEITYMLAWRSIAEREKLGALFSPIPNGSRSSTRPRRMASSSRTLAASCWRPPRFPP